MACFIGPFLAHDDPGSHTTATAPIVSTEHLSVAGAGAVFLCCGGGVNSTLRTSHMTTGLLPTDPFCLGALG